MPIERFGANPSGPGGRGLPFTAAVSAGDFVFVSGQVPMGSDGEIVSGSIVAQAHQTFQFGVAPGLLSQNLALQSGPTVLGSRPVPMPRLDQIPQPLLAK